MEKRFWIYTTTNTLCLYLLCYQFIGKRFLFNQTKAKLTNYFCTTADVRIYTHTPLELGCRLKTCDTIQLHCSINTIFAMCWYDIERRSVCCAFFSIRRYLLCVIWALLLCFAIFIFSFIFLYTIFNTININDITLFRDT